VSQLVAERFAALADPTRLALLELLAERGPQQAGALARRFPEISRPAVAKHLRVLKGAGLVGERVSGREHWYSLHAAPLAEVHKWVARYRSFWAGSLDSLARLVQDDSMGL
jgi:DNA-binding transcriptional ArsR family regulator